MRSGILLFLLNSVFLLFFALELIIEYCQQQKRRKKIKKVVHVNGIRGKSSVVRLIAAGLREGGYRVLAKATGTTPRFIYPDASEKDIDRIGPSNIIEQLKVFKEAEKVEANALVIECMALQPYFQKVCEERIVKSDVGVITNIRHDHMEIMGPELSDVTEVQSRTIPIKGVLVTAEKDYLYIMEKNAKKKKTTVIPVTGEMISNEQMKPFPFLEHKENVAVALAVCRACGVDDETAFKGFYKTVPDPGILQTFRINRDNKRFEFINAFAANDGDSTIVIWNRMAKRFNESQKKFILLHSRKDRAKRSVDILNAMKSLPADYFVIAGTGTNIGENHLLKIGVEKDKIMNLGYDSAENVFNAIKDKSGDDNIIFGIGNIVGLGMQVSDFFRSAQNV